MDRREFVQSGAALLLAGCGSGADEMPQEFTIQPSPVRNTGAVNTTVPGYEQYQPDASACTGAITASATWKLTKIGNVVYLTIQGISGTASAATNFEFGEKIPDPYRPRVATFAPVIVIDNGSSQNQVGQISISSGGVIAVFRNASGVGNFTAGANAGIIQQSVFWILGL